MCSSDLLLFLREVAYLWSFPFPVSCRAFLIVYSVFVFGTSLRLFFAYKISHLFYDHFFSLWVTTVFFWFTGFFFPHSGILAFLLLLYVIKNLYSNKTKQNKLQLKQTNKHKCHKDHQGFRGYYYTSTKSPQHICVTTQ